MAQPGRNFTEEFLKKIEKFETSFEIRSVGTVTEAGDGICQVEGLADIRSQELVQFENGIIGIAFNLETHSVGVIILGDFSKISEGMSVYSTGRIASVPVGDGLIGRDCTRSRRPSGCRYSCANRNYHH